MICEPRSISSLTLIPYPGVDLKRFRPLQKDEARNKLGIVSEEVILCPRGLGGYLNSDVILESAVEIVRKYPSTMYVFVSKVGCETELEKHIQRTRDLGIQDNFIWVGQFLWEDMPWYYSASDVMISISSNDSLPNCMLEAMACGVPVIMGDIPQIRWWVEDGVNGFLVPPRNPVSLSQSIIRLFDNYSYYYDLFTQKNLDLVKHEFDSEKNSRVIKDIVRSIARKRDA